MSPLVVGAIVLMIVTLQALTASQAARQEVVRSFKTVETVQEVNIRSRYDPIYLTPEMTEEKFLEKIQHKEERMEKEKAEAQKKTQIIVEAQRLRKKLAWNWNSSKRKRMRS